MRTPPAESSRRFGSFSRLRRSSRRMPGGTAAGTALQSGSLLITATIVSVASPPENARFPVSISNSTHPNAQMSVRSSWNSSKARTSRSELPVGRFRSTKPYRSRGRSPKAAHTVARSAPAAGRRGRPGEIAAAEERTRHADHPGRCRQSSGRAGPHRDDKIDPVDSLRDLTLALSADPDVQLAVVFGSAAKGTLHRQSDLDIAVMGVPSTTRLAGVAVTLARIAGREIDLIALETAPPLLRFEIARDGAVLVARDRHLWPDFQARAMVDWWEWAPLAQRFATAAIARLQSQAHHGPA